MGFRFTTFQDNVLIAVWQLLRLNHVKVTGDILKNSLQEHPEYPSLLSVTENLQTWKVDSLAVKVSYERLLSLPSPLMVHFKTEQLYTVTEINRTSITYLNERNKAKRLSKEEFLKQWDGIVLLAAAGEESGDSDYARKYRNEIIQKTSIPATLTIALILAILNGVHNISITELESLFPLLLSIILFAGMIASSLLLWYEIDRQNPVLQKICTGGKRTNCSAVLQSKAAKLFGIMTWSEIGFTYFAGSFLSLLLSSFNPVMVEIVAWLNLLAAPYILFSIYYQWRVAKQWCVLCLTVQALLLTGFIVSLLGDYYAVLPSYIALSDITLLIIAYLLPLFLWRKLQPLWLKAKEGTRYKLQLLRLKHDKRIFEALLPKQKRIAEQEVRHLGIILGNPEASHKLIKVCNPYCGPCARAHPKIEEIIESNPDVSAQIIFTATDDEKDSRSLPTKHLMAISAKGNATITKQALDDWYNAEQKDYSVFANKYPLNGELQQQGERLKEMSAWCEETGISFTPTFFIISLSRGDGKDEGYQLPDIYSVEDLKYLLD